MKARLTTVGHLVSVLTCFAAGTFSANAFDAVREPLAPRIDSERAAAARGDAVAASRLLRDATECFAVQRMSARLAITRADKHSVINDPDAYKGTAAETLKSVDSAQRRVDLSLSMCTGTAAKLPPEAMYDIALTAAKLGDKQAIACFLFAAWPNSKDVDPAKGAEYRQEAEYFRNHAVEKGDWRIVQAMFSASSGTMKYGYATYIQAPDEVAQLRYARLLRLGTLPETEEARNLDLSIQILSHAVPPEVSAQTDEWAHLMYAKYYSTLPPSTQRIACDV